MLPHVAKFPLHFYIMMMIESNIISSLHSYRLANRWDVISTKNTSYFVHPLYGEVFAQVMSITPYKVSSVDYIDRFYTGLKTRLLFIQDLSGLQLIAK